jgi:hypothetical protein
VFFASQHVTAAPADPCDLYLPMLASAGLSSARVDAPVLTPACHPAQPRAPPAIPYLAVPMCRWIVYRASSGVRGGSADGIEASYYSGIAMF